MISLIENDFVQNYEKTRKYFSSICFLSFNTNCHEYVMNYKELFLEIHGLFVAIRVNNQICFFTILFHSAFTQFQSS